MKELLIRTASGTVYVLVLIGSILAGPMAFGVVLGLVLFLAVRELILLTGRMDRGWHADLLGVAAMLLFTGLALAWFEAGFAAPWPFLLASSIALGLMLFLVPRSGIRRSGMQAYLSLTYLVLPLFILLALLDPWRQGISHYAFVLGLFAMIWTFDSFAYLTGKLLGKHPLAPRISPKKTWEGFAGGLLFVILAAVLWHNWHPGPGLVAWLLLALVAGIAGTLGDLFESSLKRSAGVKDSGTLIPGHGGVLDRFDSILFAAPPALLILLLFYTH